MGPDGEGSMGERVEGGEMKGGEESKWSCDST